MIRITALDVASETGGVIFVPKLIPVEKFRTAITPNIVRYMKNDDKHPAFVKMSIKSSHIVKAIVFKSKRAFGCVQCFSIHFDMIKQLTMAAVSNQKRKRLMNGSCSLISQII